MHVHVVFAEKGVAVHWDLNVGGVGDGFRHRQQVGEGGDTAALTVASLGWFHYQSACALHHLKTIRDLMVQN